MLVALCAQIQKSKDRQALIATFTVTEARRKRKWVEYSGYVTTSLSRYKCTARIREGERIMGKKGA